MSSSFVKDCSNASGSGSGNKTFIIIVSNETGNINLNENQLHSLLATHGADASSQVSVMQMGGGGNANVGSPIVTPPEMTIQDSNISSMGGIEVPTLPLNFMLEGFPATIPVEGVGGGYAELPLDADALQRLENVLHTEEAKRILGEPLLDIVKDPTSDHLEKLISSSSDSRIDTSSSTVKKKRPPPKRRSQRQMDKAEREEVVKILAENHLMFQKEREELQRMQMEQEQQRMQMEQEQQRIQMEQEQQRIQMEQEEQRTLTEQEEKEEDDESEDDSDDENDSESEIESEVDDIEKDTTYKLENDLKKGKKSKAASKDKGKSLTWKRATVSAGKVKAVTGKKAPVSAGKGKAVTGKKAPVSAGKGKAVTGKKAPVSAGKGKSVTEKKAPVSIGKGKTVTGEKATLSVGEAKTVTGKKAIASVRKGKIGGGKKGPPNEVSGKGNVSMKKTPNAGGGKVSAKESVSEKKLSDTVGEKGKGGKKVQTTTTTTTSKQKGGPKNSLIKKGKISSTIKPKKGTATIKKKVIGVVKTTTKSSVKKLPANKTPKTTVKTPKTTVKKKKQNVKNEEHVGKEENEEKDITDLKIDDKVSKVMKMKKLSVKVKKLNDDVWNQKKVTSEESSVVVSSTVEEEEEEEKDSHMGIESVQGYGSTKNVDAVDLCEEKGDGDLKLSNPLQNEVQQTTTASAITNTSIDATATTSPAVSTSIITSSCVKEDSDIQKGSTSPNNIAIVKEQNNKNSKISNSSLSNKVQSTVNSNDNYINNNNNKNSNNNNNVNSNAVSQSVKLNFQKLGTDACDDNNLSDEKSDIDSYNKCSSQILIPTQNFSDEAISPTSNRQVDGSQARTPNKSASGEQTDNFKKISVQGMPNFKCSDDSVKEISKNRNKMENDVEVLNPKQISNFEVVANSNCQIDVGDSSIEEANDPQMGPKTPSIGGVKNSVSKKKESFENELNRGTFASSKPVNNKFPKLNKNKIPLYSPTIPKSLKNFKIPLKSSANKRPPLISQLPNCKPYEHLKNSSLSPYNTSPFDSYDSQSFTNDNKNTDSQIINNNNNNSSSNNSNLLKVNAHKANTDPHTPATSKMTPITTNSNILKSNEKIDHLTNPNFTPQRNNESNKIIRRKIVKKTLSDLDSSFKVESNNGNKDNNSSSSSSCNTHPETSVSPNVVPLKTKNIEQIDKMSEGETVIRRSGRPIKRKTFGDDILFLDEKIRLNSDDFDEDPKEEVISNDDDFISNDSDADEDGDNDFENEVEDDDPERLWCICEKPHNNRFMICCDRCEDWFHGSCVGVTKSMGKQMEQRKVQWICPNCKKAERAIKGFSSPKKEIFKSAKILPRSPEVQITNEILKKKDKSNGKIMKKQENDSKPKEKTEPRVLVYEKSSGIVLSGTSAPTLNVLPDWLKENPSYTTLQPAMMNSIQTDPKTGIKRINLEAFGLKPTKPKPKTDRSFSFQEKIDSGPFGSAKKEKVKSSIKLLKHSEVLEIEKGKKAELQEKLLRKEEKKKKKKKLSLSLSTESPSPKKEKRNSIDLSEFYGTGGLKKTPVDKHHSSRSNSLSEEAAPTSPSSSKKSLAKDFVRDAPLNKKPGIKSPELPDKSPSSLKSDTMKHRESVRKFLYDALNKRKSEVSNEFKHLSEENLKLLCKEIEEHFFMTFNKDVGFKYKTRCRSLIFNIKDAKNGGLFRQILSRTIPPEKLANMTSEELASKELSEWREREEKKELEAIQKHELERIALGNQYIMKSHKGEIVIDKEDLGTKNKDTESVISLAPDASIAVNPPVDVQEDEDTINHRNHIYNPSCKICQASELQNISKEELLEAKEKVNIDDVEERDGERRKSTSGRRESESSSSHHHSKHKRKEKERDRSKERRHSHKSKDNDRDRDRHRDRSDKDKEKSKRHHHSSGDKDRSRRQRSREKQSKERDSSIRHDSTKEEKKEEDMKRRNSGSKNEENENKKRRHSGNRNEESEDKKRRHNDRRNEDRKKHLDEIKEEEEEKIVEKKNASDNEIYDVSIRFKGSSSEDSKSPLQASDDPYDSHAFLPLDILLPPLPPLPSGISELSVLDIKSRESADRSPATPPYPSNQNDNDFDDDDESMLSPATPPLPDDEEYDRLTPPPPTLPAQKPLEDVQIPIWKGVINMPDVAKFSTAAFEVSGKALFFTGDVPSTVEVVGRISPDTVWTYIAQVKKSGSKEILVVRFQPSCEEEKVSYIALYSYLSSKKRYGVIGNCEKAVKDFYIVPLASHQPIPQVLLPLDGPGFEESRPHMLIGVIIRTKHKRVYDPISGTWTNLPEPQPYRSLQGEKDSVDERSYTPPPASTPKPSSAKRKSSFGEDEENEEVFEVLTLPSTPENTDGSLDIPSTKESKEKLPVDDSKAERESMLAELNRQIERDRKELSEMQKRADKKMEENEKKFDEKEDNTITIIDDNEQDSEITSSDVGGPEGSQEPFGNAPLDTSKINIPSNLHEILASIKEKEKAIAEKENEIKRRLNMPEETSDSLSSSKDVDLRLLLGTGKDQDLRVFTSTGIPPGQSGDQDFRSRDPRDPRIPRDNGVGALSSEKGGQSSLSSLSDADLVAKAVEMEVGPAFNPPDPGIHHMYEQRVPPEHPTSHGMIPPPGGPPLPPPHNMGPYPPEPNSAPPNIPYPPHTMPPPGYPQSPYMSGGPPPPNGPPMNMSHGPPPPPPPFIRDHPPGAPIPSGHPGPSTDPCPSPYGPHRDPPTDRMPMHGPYDDHPPYSQPRHDKDRRHHRMESGRHSQSGPWDSRRNHRDSNNFWSGEEGWDRRGDGNGRRGGNMNKNFDRFPTDNKRRWKEGGGASSGRPHHYRGRWGDEDNEDWSSGENRNWRNGGGKRPRRDHNWYDSTDRESGQKEIDY